MHDCTHTSTHSQLYRQNKHNHNKKSAQNESRSRTDRAVWWENDWIVGFHSNKDASATQSQGCFHRPSFLSNTQSYNHLYSLSSTNALSNRPLLPLLRMYNRRTFSFHWGRTYLLAFVNWPWREESISFLRREHAQWLHNSLIIKAAERLSHKSLELHKKTALRRINVFAYGEQSLRADEIRR